jgi:type VI secretion system secreted protein VgrG
MNSIIALLNIVALFASVAQASHGPYDINLKSCDIFAVIGGTGVTFDGRTTTIESGSVGVAPGTSITGSYRTLAGTTEINTPIAKSCNNDALAAYNKAASLTCDFTIAGGDLGGRTLSPGVYCSSSATLTSSGGIVTLDGEGDDSSEWVFQTSASAIGFNMQLINGAKARNVYWAVGSSATIDRFSRVVGNFLASVSITVGGSAVLEGRVLGQAAVTFEDNGTYVYIVIKNMHAYL